MAAGFATVELLDATSLRVAQQDPQAIASLQSLRVERHAALLVEHQAQTADELTERVEGSRDLLTRLPLTAPAELTEHAATRAALWHIRKGLYTTVAGNRPSGTTALLEDIAVPVEALADTCERLTGLFGAHGYEDSVIFGHAKDGNIHFMLNERFGGESLDRYVAFTDDMVDLVLGNGGTLKAEHGTGRVMAPFVRRQYGDELYEVMQQVKRLCDPHTLLNPAALLNEDPVLHVSNLKVSPTVEAEVDRCVECGYCEPVCPSKDLTVTPRQRIVLRRELAKAEAAGDTALAKELRAEYQYDGIDTCAVDGMCQTACPVLINTGDLVRRLRIDDRNGVEKAAWKLAAKHWDGATKAGGFALTAVKRLPAPLVTLGSDIGRLAVGTETVPKWERYLPAGGSARAGAAVQDADAVYFPACIGTMFGPGGGGEGVSAAFLALCERAGVRLRIPEDIGAMCCGTPWKSKGLTGGYAEMRERVLPQLWEASDHGALPVVCDAASCSEGLQVMIAGVGPDYWEALDRGRDGRGAGVTPRSGHRAELPRAGLRVIDAVAFVDERVMSRVGPAAPAARLGSIALHPTCSSTHLGTNDALGRIAAAVADDVVVPVDWGCCAYAGDRGMLHPELTASATRREAAEITGRAFDAYASTNRTCELGMTRATGQQYEHILEIFERVTRPAKEHA